MRLHLLFPLLHFALVSFAQPGFNIIETTEYPQSHFRDIVVVNDTIVGYGMAFGDTVDWMQGLLLAKFDSLGYLIKSKFILDSLGDKFAIDKIWGKIIATSDGGYAITAATVFRHSAFLIKVDHDLEVEFIKEYPDTVNPGNYYYRLIEIQDGYLLYGSITRPNFLNDSFIRRVDEDGNTVWFNYYGEYDVQDIILDIEKVNDSIFIAGGIESVNSNIFGAYRTVISKIDLDGNVLQTWQSEPEPEIGVLQSIFPTADGGVIIYGQFVIENSGNTKIVQPTLAKLDADFQIGWVNHFGLIAGLNAQVTFWDIEPTQDGNYIGAGQSGIKIPGEPSKSVGWLMKFSPDGDSIWSRHDRAPLQDDTGVNHFFGGVGVLSSGNIVAGGSVTDGQNINIWLIKVTTDGCLDTLFCGLVDVGEAVPERAAGDVKVFPNPATDEITVEVEGGFPAGQVRLYDVSGRLVRRLEVPVGSSQLKFPVSELARGIYFIELNFSNGKIVRQKVVLTR